MIDIVKYGTSLLNIMFPAPRIVRYGNIEERSSKKQWLLLHRLFLSADRTLSVGEASEPALGLDAIWSPDKKLRIDNMRNTASKLNQLLRKIGIPYKVRFHKEGRCFELVCLLETEPTPVNLVLDKETVDFLLSLNTNNRRLSQSAVEAFLRSYDNIGWKSSETLCVTNESKLGNGQHRLTGLEQRNYPAGCCTTVVFGVDKESLLVVDQHSKRSATAAIKIAAGGNYNTNILAAIRHDILCKPESMSIGSATVQPSELIEQPGS